MLQQVHPTLGAGHMALEAFVIFLGSDFFEFLYHYCGHYFDALWTNHKHHHVRALVLSLNS